MQRCKFAALQYCWLNLAALVFRPSINFSMFCLEVKNVVIFKTIKNVKFIGL